MIKVINKGYTLKVTSWENDGDNYKTKFKTVDTIEEAKRLKKICTELFCSCNNGKGGVGNSMDGEGKIVVVDYFEKNKDLFPELDGKDFEEIMDGEEEIMDYFTELAYSLMGGSDFYDFRVCESVSTTYSPEDIYLEEIEF